MLINMIDLECETRQYYNVKRAYEWTIKRNENVYNIYVVYNKEGDLEGFGWKDDNFKAAMFIMMIIRNEEYKTLVPLTVEDYRKEIQETRILKVSKNKSNSYSLYIPCVWAQEFLDEDMLVQVRYQGDSIVIEKPKKDNNIILEDV